MIQFTTNVDMSLLDRAMLRFVEELNIDLPRIVKVTSRQLAVELDRYVPPKSLSQGQRAVKRDIARAMWLLDPTKIHNKVLAQAVRDQEFDVVKAFLFVNRNKGKFGTYHVEHFNPILHTGVRDRRGRVQRSKHVIVLERTEYNQYVRQVQGHVGSTRYGFGVSIRQLGGTVPNWILKHAPIHGDIKEDYNPTEPSVVMVNRGPGIEALGPSFIQRAIDRRTRAMNRDVEQVLQGRASRYFP